MTQPQTWPAPRARGPVQAVVEVPGSKSLTNRWLVLAALADGPSRIHRPLRSRDSERMVDALRALGAEVDTSADDVWSITPGPLRGGVDIDCGQAGTVMRFVPPLAALADGPVRFDGHETARSRPVGPVLDALRSLGVEVEGGPGLPYSVVGRGLVAGSHVEIDASASSQFVSALLLAAARFEEGLELRHNGSSLPSGAHLDMTVQVLEQVGVQVTRPDATTWRVAPGAVQGFEVTVEPDLSSAAPFLALAAATGGEVRLPGWPARTTQPGEQMREVLRTMGASAEPGPDGLLARGGPDGLRGADLDLSQIGELTPVVAALAVLAGGPTRIRGVGHLRGHETDRLAALETEISRLGGDVTQTDDGLEIRPAALRGATLQTYHDHRMAMFAAVVGAAVDGVLVEDVTTADKTFPGFDRAWERAVGVTR
ncbi:3-phosphoshikimate 1-carboxyvinyltransferase [Ornithinimicrobium panacihumi]|uniref:3-phosphoshikimate 1-carboxyvinyltransferase n=1 Tax=Ornithinimicrobium panacihumi TaxID=2008449 RepID=UPI003F88AA2B